jgi:predicted acyltransferase
MAVSPAAVPVQTTTAGLQSGPGRVLSIDVFRGFTMICMIGEGFGLLHFRNNPVIAPIAAQFQHVDWNIAIPRDLHFWDLIQPFFMFIVGLVMPISFARRWAAGESWGQSLAHVLKRSALLILFGLIARSVQANRPVIDLINVLAQVAFTYLVAFLLLRANWKVQGAAALGLLAVHWAIYQFASAPGVQGPWVKDANIGWYLDRLVLHKNWSGSYATINCISSAANTIFGMMTGELLLVSALPLARKMRLLALLGAVGVAAGFALSLAIPMNKKIWTASFAIYSTGMTLFALLLFYWIFDLKKKRRWATIFVMVGANSIFIYLFHEILHRWLTQTAAIFTGWAIDWWGPGGKALTTLAVIAFEIWGCAWLYRRKIFFKI